MTDARTGTAAHPRLLSFAIGALAAVVGLLPWLVRGGTMPLQNLWATRTMPDDMPFVLLPISQYYAIELFSVLLLGGVFAGIALRILRRHRALTAWAAALGVGLVHLVAVVQSFTVLAAGLGLDYGGGARALLYFAGMLGGGIAGMLLAQLALWMTTQASIGVVSLGVALAAVPFAVWIREWVIAVTSEVTPPMFLPDLLRWLPAVTVGAALVWCGVRPAWRLIAWAASLLALWVVPGLFTAIQVGLGMRVLQGDVAEMAAAGAQIFPVILAESWMPALVALMIAAIGTTVRAVVERERTSREDQDANGAASEADGDRQPALES
ncbi:hypothetical protein [Microbacterium sp.]|uniref:hypothetical protein n=1 Tax=Microbacterium sp. TaxID=51671 RepID=UPI0028113B2C|nr:hypothetical protein [Microbacterium sp.]